MASKIAKMDKKELADLGQNARSYYEQNFTRERCMGIIDEKLKKK